MAGAFAQDLFETLTEDLYISFPDADFSGPEFQIPIIEQDGIPPLTEGDLTDRTVNGTGVFDGLMQAMSAHLKQEFEKGRITGAEYAQAYIASSANAMQSAVHFLLNRDQVRWQAVLTQSQAQMAQVGVVNARVALEEAKLRYNLAQIQTEIGLADYALKKMQLVNEDARFLLTEAQTAQTIYQNQNILPAQLAGIEASTSQTEYQTDYILPAQLDDIEAGTSLKTSQKTQVDYETSDILPSQKADIVAGTSLKTAQKTQVEYQTSNILPAQKTGIEASTAGQTAQTAQTVYQNTHILPAQKTDIEAGTSLKTAQEGQVLYETSGILPSQKAKIDAEKGVIDYQLSDLYPAQVAGHTADTLGKVYTNDFLLPAQLASVREQTEGHRAKTLNTRTDGAPVAGAMGIQKALYEQQIDSYQRDAETKMVKMLFDSWITQKTMDEGLTPPTSFQDSAINTAVSKLRANLDL